MSLKQKISDKLSPLRKSLFNYFQLLSNSEGLLLLNGYNEPPEKLRRYGETLGRFNSYTLFRNGAVNPTSTVEFKSQILQARKDLYESLNKVIPKIIS